MPIPSPEITGENSPFWDACGRHELVCQRCMDCGAYRFPPMPICPRCQGAQAAWTRLSGKGVVYSWTVTRVAGLASTPPQLFRGFEDRLPFIIVVVELAEQEGLRILSNLIGASPEEIRIGGAVEVVFTRLDSGVTLPHFRLAARQ